MSEFIMFIDEKLNSILKTNGDWEKYVQDEQLFPIAIPSSGCRENSVIHELDKFNEFKEVHLFIYEDERLLYPKTFPKNVIVHALNIPNDLIKKSIAYKRQYILDHMSNKFWLMDDDLELYVKYFNKKYSIFNAMKCIQRLTDGCFITGFNSRQHGLPDKTPYGKTVDMTYFPYQCVLIDKSKTNGLRYDILAKKYNVHISEDLSFIVEGLRKGLEKCTVDCFKKIERKNHNHGKRISLATEHNPVSKEHVALKVCLEYPEYIRPKIKRMGLRWQRVAKPVYTPPDEELINACKRNSVSAVKAYLMKNNNDGFHGEGKASI